MAISAAMVWQVQNGGNDANGGAFRGGCELATPSAPSVAISSGGSIANATYYCVVTLTTGNGETSKSAETSVVSSGSNHTITVTHPTDPAVQGSTWNVYFGTVTGGPYFLGTSGSGLAFTANYAITVTPPTSGTQAPGTDRSLGNSAQVVVNNTTITCTTTGANSNTLTFTAGYTPSAADVGNVFHTTAGTNIRLGWYEITGWSATTWTVTGGGNLTTAGGAGSAITGNMGGALATPGGLGAADALDGVANQTGFINYNASAFSCTSTANVSGGRLSLTTAKRLVGYDTTRTVDNTDANRPTLDAGSATMTVLTNNFNNAMTRSIIVTNSAARATITGFSIQGSVQNCKADSCTTTGFSIGGAGNPGTMADCLANACATGFSGGSAGTLMERCVSLAHTTSGFTMNANAILNECIAKGGTATGFSSGGQFFRCVSRDNSGAGSAGFSSSGVVSAISCIAWNNGGINFNPSSSASTGFYANRVWNCAGGGSTSNFPTINASTTGLHASEVKNFVSLGADPHVDAANGNLALNSTSNGGTLCKAAGLPSTFQGLSTTGYPDIGPVQTQAPTAQGLLYVPNLEGV